MILVAIFACSVVSMILQGLEYERKKLELLSMYEEKNDVHIRADRGSDSE